MGPNTATESPRSVTARAETSPCPTWNWIAAAGMAPAQGGRSVSAATRRAPRPHGGVARRGGRGAGRGGAERVGGEAGRRAGVLELQQLEHVPAAVALDLRHGHQAAGDPPGRTRGGGG